MRAWRTARRTAAIRRPPSRPGTVGAPIGTPTAAIRQMHSCGGDARAAYALAPVPARQSRAAGHHEEGRRRHLARIFREPRCCLILEQFRGFAEFVRVGGRLVGLFFCRPGVLPPYPRCLSACRGQHYARFYGARARAAMRNTCFGPSPQRLRCGPPRLPCKVARAQAIKWRSQSATVRATPWSCCAIASLDRIRRKLR